MMKKISLVILALCVIAITSMSVMALEPLVISGEAKFGGVLYINTQVTIEDDQGSKWFVYTTSSGIYIIDASNLRRADMSYVSSGDTLTLTVCPKTVTGCSKSVIVSNIPKTVNFNVAADPTIVNPPDDSNDDTSDDDSDTDNGDSNDIDCGDCDISLICPECPKCGVCPTIPEGTELWKLIVGALIALGLGGAGGYLIKRKEAMSKGVGLKIYTGRDGKEKVLHKHPGIKGYHDPFVSHRVKQERHDKGELTPKYIKEAGVWVYQA